MNCEVSKLKNVYSSKVLIDGWFDNRVLEEEIVKDFLAKRDSGQLMIQKMGSLLKKMSQCVSPSTTADGYVRFGDQLQIINVGSDPNMVRLQRVKRRAPTVLSIDAADEMLYFRNELPDPSSCTASFKLSPLSRNLFELISSEQKKVGEKVTYGEPIYFKISPLLGPTLYLSSDNCPYASNIKQSRHQEINCIGNLGFTCQFLIQHIDPRLRMQHEGCAVKVSDKFILTHVKSNQALAVESRFYEKTFFGYEHEASAFTYLDDHKAEMDYNHWIFKGKKMIGGNTDLVDTTKCHYQEEPNRV